jgi:hypothetical protein
MIYFSRTRKVIDLDVDVKAVESTLRWISEQEEDKILAEIAKEEIGEIANKSETAAFLDEMSQYLPNGVSFAK